MKLSVLVYLVSMSCICMDCLGGRVAVETDVRRVVDVLCVGEVIRVCDAAKNGVPG